MNVEEKILKTLTEKSALKQKVYDNTLEAFRNLKKISKDIVRDYNRKIEDKGKDKRILLDFKDRSEFDAELKVAGDLLFFSMHTNIFEFYRAHNVWKTTYVKSDKSTSFCGIINIYNFLADSFKYKRTEDLGYLIARIFINKDMCYFVEGKRQMSFMYNDFGTSKLDEAAFKKIINSAIQYSLDFDLLVPPYDTVKIASVSQMQEKFYTSKVKTGKRLGFNFHADED